MALSPDDVAALARLARIEMTAEELARLERTHDELKCYEVEVCAECGWNHLRRSYLVGRRVAG